MEACERGEAGGIGGEDKGWNGKPLTDPKTARSLTTIVKRPGGRVPVASLTFGKYGTRRGEKIVEVSGEEFHKGCETAAQRLFAIYDVNKTGVLSDSEMAHMLLDFHRSCGITASLEDELEIVDGMKLVGPKKELVPCMMCSGKKGMCLGCFTAMLEVDWKTVGDVNVVAERLAVRGEEFEHQGLEDDDARGFLRRCAAHTFRSSVLQWVIFMIIYAGISAAVAWIVLQPFVRNDVLFSQYGVGISFARSGAALIIVGTMFLLLSVNKVFLELLFRGISRFVYLHMPMVEVHKVLAGIILCAAIMHGIAWMVTFAQWGDNEGWVNYDPEYDEFPSFGASCRSSACLYRGYVAITGYCMLGILCLGYIISTQKAILWLTRAFPRLKPYVQNFTFFYWCHIVMAVAFVGLLLLGHPLPGLPSLTKEGNGSIAWIFLALPILLFAYQVIILTIRAFLGRTRVVACEALPGNVVTFQCPVPKTALECKAGEYAKIMIPAVHVREWHPFTLSGDPESGTLQFHIKSLGDWTGRLYELAKSGRLMSQRVIVQGSFTTRAREYKNFNAVVFVATGIGATPFTSIIQKALQRENPDGRVYYFHWIVREQVAAQTWFIDLLQDVENASKDSNVKIIVWFTGAKLMKRKGAVQTKLLDLSTYAYLEKSGCELITGITRKNYNVQIGIGRPAWGSVFTTIRENHSQETDIGVFFCGAPPLRRELSKLCSKHSTVETAFKFHSEEFLSW